MVILCNIQPGKKASKMHFYEFARYLLWQTKPLKLEIQLCDLSSSVAIYVLGHRARAGCVPSFLSLSCTSVPGPSTVMQKRMTTAVPHDFQIGNSGTITEPPNRSCQTSFPRCWEAGSQSGGWRGLWSPNPSATKEGHKKWMNLAQILYWQNGDLWDRQNCNISQATVILKAAQVPTEHSSLNHLYMDCRKKLETIFHVGNGDCW